MINKYLDLKVVFSFETAVVQIIDLDVVGTLVADVESSASRAAITVETIVEGFAKYNNVVDVDTIGKGDFNEVEKIIICRQRH